MSASKNLIQAAAGVGGGGSFYDYEIDYSARFNEVDNPILYRTQGTPTDQDVWTLSCWIKRADVGSNQQVWFSAQSASPNANYERIMFRTDNAWRAWQCWSSNTDYGYKDTTSVFRDPSSWAHYVVSRSGTTITAYVNGVEQSLSGTAMTAGQAIFINQSGVRCNFGSHIVSDAPYDESHAYFSEAVFIDGQALTPTSFGQLKNGIWVPEDVSGLTFGNNGFYLDFADSSNLGNDVSGNNNDFTSSGLTSSDQMIDTPTNNFATLPMGSPRTGYVPTVSEGNLKYVTQNSTGTVCGTGIPRSGVWYVEWQSPNCYPGNGYRGYFGLTTVTNGDKLSSSSSYWLTQSAGKTYVGSDYINYGTGVGTGTNSLGPGDIGSLTIDMDNLEITFRLNNSVVASGVTIQDAPHTFCLLGDGTSSRPENTIFNINFGQNGDFNGYETAQGNTDANGIGDFYYAPPSGALALCTANLPEPIIGPNIDDTAVAGLPEEQFNVLRYEGNSTNNRDITGVGFDPDLGIFKNHDEGYGWIVVDRNRGDGWSLGIDTGAQESGTGKFDSFITDGYRIDNHPGLNRSSIVNYSWKAGGTASSNTDGDITSNVSANTDAGISIVTYTGNGSSNQTVGHGLGADPAMVIIKRYQSGYVWRVWHSGLSGDTYYLGLNQTSAESSSSTVFNGHSSTTFTVGNDSSVNGSSGTMVAYVFAEVEGFSSFGSYTGNGSADGSFIYTGFRPAFIITKRTNTSGYNWVVMDAGRDQYNVADAWLYADSSSAEVSNSSTRIDFLSNGFKLRGDSSTQNGSGGTYVYMAFAENPFKYSNAR